MTRLYPFFALIFSFACTDSPKATFNKAVEKIEYGDKILNDGLPPLGLDYRPKGLSQKTFQADGKNYVPANFQNQTLHLIFDVENKVVTGRAQILFDVVELGHPVFLLDGELQTARFNGQSITFETVTDPDGLGVQMFSLGKNVLPQTPSIMEIEFVLPSKSVTFVDRGLGFLTSMTDLAPARFFERWGPAGFEDDAFSLVLHLEIKNSDQQHQIFANGHIARRGPLAWTVSFPSHFTSSSFYIHLSNRVFTVRHFSIPGQERSIPVTVYAADPGIVEQATAVLPRLFQEMERDFGPYPHSQFIAYMHLGSGGMEYTGATITGIGALGHELFHSWFARGVMPAEGRSGWIDEAFASWRDHGYFQAKSLLSRPPSRLAKFSPFRRSTPENSYRDGRQLLAEFDLLFSSLGGMKPLMKSFFERYRYQVVTTEELTDYLETKTGFDLDPFFQRYAYGIGVPALVKDFTEPNPPVGHSYHPPAFSEEEIQLLR